MSHTTTTFTAGTEIPLFPLQTLLFPEVSLKLKIFEERYLNLVKQCMKEGTGFGVVSIREGEEVGPAPSVFEVGLYVDIIDWFQQENGLLGLSVVGSRKFKLLSTRVQGDGLMVAAVEELAQECEVDIDQRYDGLLGLLQELKQHSLVQVYELPEAVSSRQLGWQLCQLLPLSLVDKVALLEVANPEQRLDQLANRISDLMNPI